MKKDDQEPKKPRKKPQKKSAGKSLPKDKKQQPEQKHIIDLSDIGKRNSLSIGQIAELSKRDKRELTPYERKALEDANKMARLAWEQLSVKYDFAEVGKAIAQIQQLPLAKFVDDVRKTLDTTLAISEAVRSQTAALAMFQKNIAIQYGAFAKQLSYVANAALIARGLFADFSNYHTHLVKALSVDIPSLGAGSRFSAIETVSFSVQSVSAEEGQIVAESEANQKKEVGDYVLVHSAKLELMFTEIKATRSDTTEIKRLIQSGIESGIAKIQYADVKFRRETSKLILKGFEIAIKRTSRQAQFCDFFFSSKENFTKKWDIEEFVSQALSLHKGIDGNEEYFVSVIKGYVTALNSKIAAGSKGYFINFFVLMNYEVYINPDYLAKL